MRGRNARSCSGIGYGPVVAERGNGAQARRECSDHFLVIAPPGSIQKQANRYRVLVPIAPHCAADVPIGFFKKASVAKFFIHPIS
jgi:hypothetical protein